MLSLPNDVLYVIFSYCDSVTLKVLCCVCKRFRDLAASNCLWAPKSRHCLVTNQLSPDIKSRSCCILSAKEKCRISFNWRKGICDVVCVIRHQTRYMPWLQMNSHGLWVSQGDRILEFSHFKPCLVPKHPKFVYKSQADVCRFVAGNGLVVSGSSDGTIMGWYASTGRGQLAFKSCDSHEGEVNTIDHISDVLISGSRDRSVKIWTLNGTISERQKIPFRDRIWSVSISPSCDSFICGTGGKSDHPLMLYDLSSAQQMATLGSDYSYGAGVLHGIYETPSIALTCGYDTYIRQWDLRSPTSKCVQKWENPFDLAVYCISSDHNNTFVSGSSSHGLVWLWDKRSTKPVRMRYVGMENSPVYSITFDPCHLYVSLDRSLYLFDYSVYAR